MDTKSGISGLDLSGLDDFASRLVRCQSVLRDEEDAAQCAAEEMTRLGFDSVEIDPVGNAVGVLRGDRQGPTLWLDAHIDTVDVEPRAEWSRDPFSGDLEDGKLWGRGSSDMKGALAAMVHGIGSLDRNRLAGSVVVAATLGEETIEGAALREAAEHMRARDLYPSYVIIGEASELDLVVAGRGRAEVVLTTHGIPCHASTPDQGRNAVQVMFRVVEEIGKLEMKSHAVVGEGVQCLTDIISSPYPAHSVVPVACRATLERRLVPGETEESFLGELEQAFERADASDTTVELATSNYTSYRNVTFVEKKWFPPWETDPSSLLVERALAGLEECGQTPKKASYRFCTNGAWCAGMAGIPTIGYGPSHEGMAHIVDEYLELDQLHQAASGYAAIALKVLN